MRTFRTKKYNLPRITLAVIIAVICVSFQPNNLIDRLIQSLKDYTENNPQEKVYLSLDNPFYVAGETIYFKAYLPSYFNPALKTASGILYTDLYNVKNKLVLAYKSKIKDGITHGSISLPDTLENGNYTLVSYTNWMRNFDTHGYFRKSVNIYNAYTALDQKPSLKKNEAVHLFFFPEGGQLINNLESKVVFKAILNSGSGTKINGALLDENNNKICELYSNNLGIGTFKIKPTKGKKYYVKLKNSNFEKKYQLPPTKNVGIVLSVDSLNSQNLQLSIQSQGKNSNLLITLQNSSKIFLTKKIKLVSKDTMIYISKTKIPTGINQITIFNRDTQLPIINRLIFINHEKQLNIKIIPEKTNYKTRENVKAKIRITDQNNKPIKGNFSVRVSNRIPNRYADNIYSYLQLSSKLKDDIENPNYYLMNKESDTNITLDNLLITLSLKGLSWHDLLNYKYKEHLFAIEKNNAFLLKHKLTMHGEPIRNKPILVLLMNKLSTYQGTTDNDGLLELEIASYFGKERFIYQKNGDKTKSLEIDKNRMTKKTVITKNTVHNHEMPEEVKTSIQNFLINQTYTKNNNLTKSPLKNTLSQNNYQLLCDKLIYLKDYVKFNTMAEIIKEILPGVNIRKSKQGKFQVKIYAKFLKHVYKLEPLYIVNGQPTFDTDFILHLNANFIKSIGIIHSPDNLIPFGEVGTNGVMIINTSEEIKTPNDKNIIEFKGFNIVKEYYQPKYDNEETKNNSIPDFRSVLYWNPTIITDENGETTVEFYTSDEVSNYNIAIEGLSSTGQIGTLNQAFINVTRPTSMK